MKKATALGLVIFAAAIAGALLARSISAQNTIETERLSRFMRAKLVHSQKVLEGLTTENYDLIAKHAQDLTLLSQDASWRVLMTGEYAERSIDFRRATLTLTKAGKEKNLDGATLAYVNVTLKCVECHKYVRSVKQVRWAPLETNPKIGGVPSNSAVVVSSAD